MNEATHSTETETLNLTRVCKATRFAVACIVFGFSYHTIRSSLNISKFERIFMDMLGENETLPLLTIFVLRARHVFLALSIGIPVACFAFLFVRDVARSICCIGVLILLSILEWTVIDQATWSPMTRIIEKMQGG